MPIKNAIRGIRSQHIHSRSEKKKKKKGGGETARVYNNTLLCMNWVLLSRYQHPEKEENLHQSATSIIHSNG